MPRIPNIIACPFTTYGLSWLFAMCLFQISFEIGWRALRSSVCTTRNLDHPRSIKGAARSTLLSPYFLLSWPNSMIQPSTKRTHWAQPDSPPLDHTAHLMYDFQFHPAHLLLICWWNCSLNFFLTYLFGPIFTLVHLQWALFLHCASSFLPNKCHFGFIPWFLSPKCLFWIQKYLDDPCHVS